MMTERKAGHILLTGDTSIVGSTREGGVLAHNRTIIMLFVSINSFISR